MQVAWFRKAKSPEHKQEIQQIVNGSQKVLDILLDICYNTIQDSEKSRVSRNFDNPSWAYEQAYLNGYIKAYSEISLLCNTSDKDASKGNI